METNSESILIAGTGALACLFAAYLARAGATVMMLGSWKEGLSALRQNGVQIIDIDGSLENYEVSVTNDPETCKGSRLALVLVKSWQTGRVARQLAKCLAKDGIAISMQNGLGNREELVEILGEERVALGVTTSGATLLGPGRVQAAGKGFISLENRPHLYLLAEWLQRAGFVVEATDDLQKLLWSKLVINAAINPLTAVLEVPNGFLAQNRYAHEVMAGCAREAAAIASAQGIGLSYADPVKAAEQVARNTANNYSSMLQDIRRGAPTEIDAINGAIMRVGDHYGIATPITRTFYQLIKTKTQLNKGKYRL